MYDTPGSTAQPQLMENDDMTVVDVGGGEHSQARRACNLQIDHPTTLHARALVEAALDGFGPILEWALNTTCA